MSKKWKIFLLQHSHVDIGYTERQEKIGIYQTNFIRQAVDGALAKKEGQISYEAPFRFTCECFWAIEQYLNKYGEQGKDRLLEGIREGHLELSAFYLHNGELLTRENIIKSIDRSYQFAKAYDLPLNIALACDITGFPWAMADILADHDISYLMTAINTHHAGAPFKKPLVPFYWEGPEGKKVLVWSGLTYYKANLLGLIPGLNPMDDPGIPGMMSEDDKTVLVKDLTYAKKRVPQMIEALEKNGYPYTFFPISGGGLFTDNSPITVDYLGLVDQWNEAYGDEIEIVTATVEEFFHHLEEHGGSIPTYRGDWNDWWTDGAISTPAEVKSFRHAQRLLDVIESLNDDDCVSREEIKGIEDKLFLFAEHTWGHSASEPYPWHFMVHQLDYRKCKHAYDADVLASEAMEKIQRRYGEGEFRVDRPYSYRITNPLDVSKVDVFLLPVDFWEVDQLGEDFIVADDHGRTYDYQIIQTLRGTNVCVIAEVGAKQTLTFEIVYEEEKKNDYTRISRSEKGVCRPEGESCFENDYYKLTWTDEGITSIVSKDSEVDIIEKGCQLGQPVYQIFKDGERRDAAGFGYSSRTKPKDTVYEGVVQKVSVVEEGAVYVKLSVLYEIKGAHHFELFVTMYHSMPVMDINVNVTKTIELDPEGFYIHLPFTVDNGRWYIEKQGIFIEPGKDQLPDTCKDYYSVSHGALMRNDEMGIALSVLDAPMVMIGGLNLWDYKETVDSSGTMYSWLTNNKWETNFKIHCGGLYDFRYRLEFGSELCCEEKAYKKIHANSYELLSVRA